MAVVPIYIMIKKTALQPLLQVLCLHLCLIWTQNT